MRRQRHPRRGVGLARHGVATTLPREGEKISQMKITPSRFRIVRFGVEHVEVLPRLAVGYEPPMFGDHGTYWVEVAWLKWAWQMSYEPR